MADINNLTIIGRLTKDVELSTVGSNNTALGKFSIATSIYTGKEDYTSFFDCIVWGKKAEIINQYMSKGSQIIINGQIKQERFKTKDGQNASKVVINVVDFQFGSKSDGKGDNQSKPKDDSFNDDIDFGKTTPEDIPF